MSSSLCADRHLVKGPISWQCRAGSLHEPQVGRGPSFTGLVMPRLVVSFHLISSHLISCTPEVFNIEVHPYCTAPFRTPFALPIFTQANNTTGGGGGGPLLALSLSLF